ncbi:hypothetical protein LOCC1_G007685 [Lachnellula occidentalis]|uniref:Uncharacterized protein n=1 Tax=Lachnellula occidentalis TaxID=215460 RepID=A0A8H8RTU9_9HELO|nr:hypothetical protein LOCC1_G007685 [Lachnellula occidentalis]
MSPTAFKQQVTQLLAEMTTCYQFCDAIRENRRLGSTHEALDKLQSDIKHGAWNIQSAYDELRHDCGSRVELGDEMARTALNRAIRTVQSNIQTRLSEIAYRQRDSHNPENPGFRKLNDQMTNVEADVLDELENLGTRFKNATAEVSKPAAPKQLARPKLKADEVVILSKELDVLMQHLKSSWIETSVAGEIFYVNAFDDKKRQWERPNGFIKAPHRTVPKPTTHQQTWEQPTRRPARDDTWSNGNGCQASSVDPVLVRAALRSPDEVALLCRTELEKGVYGMLLGTERALVTSSRDAYMELRKFYVAFSYHMSHRDFKEFTNPANQICQLLQSHFLALQLTMTPVTNNEWVEKDRMTKHGVTSRWFGALRRDIPEDMKGYYEWPMWVEKEVKHDRLYNGIVTREVEVEF